MMQQSQAMQQYGGQQQFQYMPVPTPQMVQMVPQGAEQQGMAVPEGGYAAASAPSQPSGGNFLEALMPTGWRKRQRPSKRPASRVQKVPNGRKIFVGGLSPNSTAESLIKHFCEFGKISDASVIHEAVSRKSRGFGYVEFAEKIPDGLLEMEHFIDQRRCGVRGYNYDPAEDTGMAASAA